MKSVRLFAIGLALAGLAASLAWHLYALGGRLDLGPIGQPLLIALCVVYAIALLGLQPLSEALRGSGTWAFLRIALFGAPTWTRWFGCLAGPYCVAILYLNGGHLGRNTSLSAIAAQRVTSAVLVMVYGLSLAFLFAALRREGLRIRWRCPNGHTSAEPAASCPECGAHLRPVTAANVLGA